MSSLFHKIHRDSWVLWNLPKIIWFNFHYLPFKQAIRLPIWLRKIRLLKSIGKIVIDSPKVFPGMIRLGSYSVSVYPDNGVCFENKGILVFKGRAGISNFSGISIAGGGKMIIGDNVTINASKLVCYSKICIEDNVMIGWESKILDCDLHHVVDFATKTKIPNKGPIMIGHHTWLCNNVTITKNVSIPPNTIVASHSVVNKSIDVPEYSLVAGIPVVLKKSGVSWEK